VRRRSHARVVDRHEERATSPSPATAPAVGRFTTPEILRFDDELGVETVPE